MVLFRITENEPSKMHNVRPYVYSRPWMTFNKLLFNFSLDKSSEHPEMEETGNGNYQCYEITGSCIATSKTNPKILAEVSFA